MLALAATGCASLGVRPPLHPYNPEGAWYVVQPGERLADIAARARVPEEDLLEINGLARATPLLRGQLIFVLYPDDDRSSVRAAEPPLEPPAVAGAMASRFRWPLGDPRLSSPFGLRQGRVHEGIDLGAPLGTPVHAAAAGKVLYAGDGIRGYGNLVVLEHPGDLVTVYAHNSVLLVRAGDRISGGQEIARVGQSGRATAPHLHFEVRQGQVPRDPLRYLPSVTTKPR